MFILAKRNASFYVMKQTTNFFQFFCHFQALSGTLKVFEGFPPPDFSTQSGGRFDSQTPLQVHISSYYMLLKAGPAFYP